jgi:hypothetical protein
MKPAFPEILLLWPLAASAIAAGPDITFYQLDGFQGRAYAANQTISNFADIGFNDHANSVVIRGGAWQLCSDAYFRGRCVTLNPGEYPSLASMGLANVVSSARELGDWPGGAGGGGRRDRVVLYEGTGFSGRTYDVNGIIANFDGLGFNDRARSMVISEGTWELCIDSQFNGYCEVFGPGRHANLGRLTGELSSMRPVTGAGGGGGWGGGSRAILYEGTNLTGRSFVIGGEVLANLDGTGFNDRASSLRIEGGYWLFCTDAHFGGDCRTFGPGEYPTLPWGIANRISSGRRIHGTYPYNATPNWSGPR